MISNNYIPEKINDANAYLDGTRMIGVAASVDLPEINMGFFAAQTAIFLCTKTQM